MTVWDKFLAYYNRKVSYDILPRTIYINEVHLKAMEEMFPEFYSTHKVFGMLVRKTPEVKDVPRKYNIGDEVYYVNNFQIKKVTIKSHNPVFNTEDIIIDYSYSVVDEFGKGLTTMAHSDGMYAPIGIKISQNNLFSSINRKAIA